MAPQVTVYFHKLPTTGQGANGCRMTFTLGPLSIKLEVPNDEHVPTSKFRQLQRV